MEKILAGPYNPPFWKRLKIRRRPLFLAELKDHMMPADYAMFEAGIVARGVARCRKDDVDTNEMTYPQKTLYISNHAQEASRVRAHLKLN